MELWDKDPGGLAGDLGRRLREAGKERGKELLTCGSGLSGNAGSHGRAAERRCARSELGRGVGSENRQAERGSRQRAAGCGVKEGESWARGERGKEDWAGRVGSGPGKGELGWAAGLGCWAGLDSGFLFSWVFSSILFPLSFLFLNQTKFEFNTNLNSNHTQVIKTMHQHECNTKI